EAWREAAAGDPGAVVFDTLEDADLDRIAAMLWEASAARPLFCVAAQGLAEGLGRHMAQVTLARRRAQAGIADAGPMLVLSGSAAPQNAVQIERALAAGWEGIRVDMARALSETDRPGLAREVGEAMLAALRG
ncbi:four-carbon acid sugar kinase family protein, partial [Bordetella bronchiseptica]